MKEACGGGKGLNGLLPSKHIGPNDEWQSRGGPAVNKTKGALVLQIRLQRWMVITK